MKIWLLLLFSLSPQHKQLVNMVKQGDMIAADELARSVCDQEGTARAKTGAELRRRLRKARGKAADMLRQELDRCAPAGADSATDQETADPAKPRQPARGRRPLRLIDSVVDEGSADSDGTEATTGRRPVVAEADDGPAEAAVAKEHEPKRGARSPLGSEHDSPSAQGEPDDKKSSASPDALPDLAPLADTRVSHPVTARMEDSGPRSGSRETLRDAMFFYGVGGGFVAASSMSYLMAAAALGWGVFSSATLPPLADPNAETNGGKTLQQVRDQQLTGIWLQSAGLAFASVVVATGSLVAGMVLMGKGSEAVDAY